MRRFTNDTATVRCIRKGREQKKKNLMNNFVSWCRVNYLQLNTAKTKEIVVDIWRSRPHLQPVTINVERVEVVQPYKYLGLQLGHKLDWLANIDSVNKKAQNRLYFLMSLLSSAVSCWTCSTRLLLRCAREAPLWRRAPHVWTNWYRRWALWYG